MDNHKDALVLQQRSGHPYDGVQVLRFCMGWVLHDDSVFLYGTNYGYVFCGCVDHTQAVELLTSGVQFDT